MTRNLLAHSHLKLNYSVPTPDFRHIVGERAENPAIYYKSAKSIETWVTNYTDRSTSFAMPKALSRRAKSRLIRCKADATDRQTIDVSFDEPLFVRRVKLLILEGETLCEMYLPSRRGTLRMYSQSST